MFNKLFISLSIAIKNVRTNLFHTLLSILGVVIGVAALVSILSLIDGMEKSIRDSITDTISLQSITIKSDRFEQLNNVRLEKESFPVITVKNLQSLENSVDGIASASLKNEISTRLHLAGQQDTVGGTVHSLWTLRESNEGEKVLAGRLLSTNKTSVDLKIAEVNRALAEKFDMEPKELLDKDLVINGQTFSIVGVVDSEADDRIQVQIPFSAMKKIQTAINPPVLYVEAEKFEEVDRMKNQLEEWLDEEFVGGSEQFSVTSSKLFFKAASQGMLFFKIVMGLITGISVLVGGVGIMNVLLISVKERTKEIGIRKATGARKKDIVLQFLSESITISMLGSVLGLIVGLIGTFGLVAIIQQVTETSYQAVFTWGTLTVVAVVAVLIGIIFGTYPAMKAARLTPVDAIRYE